MTGRLLAAVCGAFALITLMDIAVPTPAAAQEWRRGEFRRFPGPHRFGPCCMFRVDAEGFGNLKLFSSRGKKKAQARAVESWEEQVAQEFGPQWASWGRARGQSVDCRNRGLEVRCVASANPCT